ncbi:hypothetical protein DDB_G0275343 [Dictyostelium discoideum AX4]|uniref:Uncharacterized protein n=1 Tax=Dictyostelium discoideum TaxID=44689 RepID=Q553Q3_DICDI|nr:hypothetical protein DDB_G0275343 [Dictyostelium discoideum AX4]EAL69737.1 hypothetical protein DDB_G0275343 [Dictyostelium discoideum AX4]|eukprot:XP_643667.1 hypothetical protein DDB_G0275343 [Dictyostelium discoideum AX4]
METNYHIYSDNKKNNLNKIIETTPTSIKYELPDVLLLSDNDKVEGHPLTDPYYTKEDKGLMKLMLSYFVEFMRLSKMKPLSDKKNKDRPHFNVQLDGNEKLRCIINNYEKALEMKNYCCVGFFGTKSFDAKSKLNEIITSDDALVSILPEFPSIIGYVTIQKEKPKSQELLSHLPNTIDDNYANIVIIENFEVVNEWRRHTVHRDANQYLSPLYYHMVRIHNAQISIPAECLSEYFQLYQHDQLDINFIRTKYYSFTPDGKVNLRALREYKELSFASFLSPNSFEFFKEIVNEIGKKLKVSTKLIDIYSLINQSENAGELINEPPHKLMVEYGVDFAFMCGLAFVNAGPKLLSPLVSPVRIEDHYQNKPIYFSNLIVKNQSTINELSKDLTFIHNGKDSFSGYQILNSHLINNHQTLSIENYFKNSIFTGSHLNSIESIKSSQVNDKLIASIDSTVLDTELLNNRISLENDIKIIKTLGPSAMPPLVSKLSSPHSKSFSNEIQNYLSSNEISKLLEPILLKFNYKRFEIVNSSSFDDIRKTINLN